MDNYLSEIRAFAFPFVPRGWLPCDGRSLPVATNLALYHLIGNTYGGDGSTFKLPDLRERVTIGNGPAYPYFAQGGEERHPLTLNEMPRHTHQAVASTINRDSTTPEGHYWPADSGYTKESNALMSVDALALVGYGKGHDNMSPYQAINYAIATEGIFPSGNFGGGYLGSIKLFPGKLESEDCVPCDGRVLPIASHAALFSLLGSSYGGDGKTTFALPDLRGRAPVCFATGRHDFGLTEYQLGQAAGVTTVTLTPDQMPFHYHPAVASTNGNVQSPEGQVWANDDNRPPVKCFASQKGAGAPMNRTALGEAGGDQPHNNMMPFQAIQYLIVLAGLYPQRP